LLWQEEEEADYKEAFPDHAAAFVDILQDEHECNAGPGGVMDTEQQATQAEAGSAAAQALLHGDLLKDVVELHGRCWVKKICQCTGHLLCIMNSVSHSPGTQEGVL
jgi:hypothetical protein